MRSTAGLRLFLLLGCGILLGCGGQIDGASPDDDASSGVSTCDRSQGTQTIAHVPGYPWLVASAGGTTYVVTQIAPADASGFASTQGMLYRVDTNGTAHAVTDDFVDPYSVTSVGSAIGFLHVAFDPRGYPYDDAVESIAADGSATTLESSNDRTSFSALTSDDSTLSWYRWSPDRQGNPVPAIERSAPSGAPTKLAIGPDVTGVGDFASDGTSYFAAFATADSSTVLGRMPVGDTPELALVNDATDAEIAGVDSKNVYYVTLKADHQHSQLWSIPKSGGSPTPLAETPMIPRLVLRDGYAYWIDYESTQDNIMGVSLDGLSAASQLSATSFFIASIAANECGLVIASPDPDDDTNTIVMQLAL